MQKDLKATIQLYQVFKYVKLKKKKLARGSNINCLKISQRNAIYSCFMVTKPLLHAEVNDMLISDNIIPPFVTDSCKIADYFLNNILDMLSNVSVFAFKLCL